MQPNVKFDFSGKRVIVTGGSRGIGRAIALEFARSGAAVSICARNLDALATTRAELAALGPTHTQSCDLSSAEAIAAYVEDAATALGGIDILVNNASGFGRADDESGWHTAFGVDVMSIVRASHAAQPWLEQAAPEGVIINIGSTAATRPSIKAPAYGAMKAAIRYHTATQAALLAKRGIRVNSVAPGSVTAPGHFWEERKARNDPAYHEAVATIPAGRLGQAEEIADAVLFMASSAARWVYGQTLIVDGGQTLFGG
jgi:3-oxoacyl-[acyl-carrier protein] reductase